jgi:broad specificity phosphatase PhoE/predicted MPP superfamily phosphohydrolase
MKVYLIRHGLTDAILSGLYCGATDVPVNREGLLLLKQNAAKNLYPAGNGISIFAASALSRTAQTLRAIYGADAQIVASASFNELDFGEYEMKTDLDLREHPEYGIWVEDYLHRKPAHGESIDDLWLRMVSGFEELNALYQNIGDIFIVSHGISIATVLYKLFAYPLLLSVPQPGEGYLVELGFDSAGHLLPSGARFLSRISDLEKNAVLWTKPNNFSYFTNRTSKLTILHSNDLHGQFLFKAARDYTLHGGISLLSGYIKRAREENPNVIFTISGDLMEKSLLDKTVKEIDAVDICNYLSPDLIALGNHELNYGLSQLLLFEKCTNFPIINANLYTRHLQQPLLPPYHIKSVNGVRMMFIGVLEEAMFQKMPLTGFERESIEYKDSLTQIKQICGLYKTPDIDLVILLSHLGIEKDIQLARSLPKEYGVRVILGGHTHRKMDEPVI